ncbi:MAG: lipid A deacylase LpxR family protein [Kangiellaceae bacterium]
MNKLSLILISTIVLITNASLVSAVHDPKIDDIQFLSGLPSASIATEKRPYQDWIWETEIEPNDTGWSLYVDNDLFAFGSKDKDYTGGLSVTLAGQRAADYAFSLNDALNWINELSGFANQSNPHDRLLHSLEVGFTIFTPEAISDRSQQVGDRPYASLIYLSNTQEKIDLQSSSALVSTLTIGVMGSSIAENLQTKTHKLLGSETPVGWENQISKGGELVARYSIARQELLYTGNFASNNIEVSTTWQASIGYLTEGSFGLATRIGNFDTPWYSFRPQFNDYSEKSSSLAGLSNSKDEFYFWGGFNLHARAYNTFLQGQFKSNNIDYSSSEIRNLIVDGWIGVTKQWSSGWRTSYFYRAQTSEVKVGRADRSAMWGGIILSKSF